VARALLGRRRILSSLAVGAMLLASCQSVQGVLRPVPPSPVARRVVRIGRPLIDTYAWASGQVSSAANRIAPERDVQVQIQPVDLVKTTRGSGGEVTVRVTDPEEWPEAYAVALGQMTGRDAPDLVLADSRWLSALGKANVLRDLAPLLHGEQWYNPDDFLGNALRAGQVRGRQLALPLLASAEVLLYDRRAFQDQGISLPQPGWTWSEFTSAARALRSPGGPTGRGRWGAFVTPAAPSLWTMAWQWGAQLISASGEQVDFTEPGTIEALEFLSDLIHRDNIAPPVDARSASRFAEALGQREAAMLGTFVGGLVWWRTSTHEGYQLAELPARRPIVVGHIPIMVGIHRRAPDEGRSIVALRALLEASKQTMVLPTRRGISDLRKLNSFLTENDALVLSGAVESARFLPGDLPFFQISPIVERDLVLPVLTGRRTPRQAAEDAQPSIDNAVRRFRSS
jgi:multiple sugar transport system substrate-binding protein